MRLLSGKLEISLERHDISGPGQLEQVFGVSHGQVAGSAVANRRSSTLEQCGVRMTGSEACQALLKAFSESMEEFWTKAKFRPCVFSGASPLCVKMFPHFPFPS